MYDGRTNYTVSQHTNDERFQTLLQNAADTIAQRLRSYDAKTDPLKESHLKLLYDIVSSEVDRVEAGLGYIYAGLGPPINAASEWGEPVDSDLIAALREAEIFFRSGYGKRTNRIH